MINKKTDQKGQTSFTDNDLTLLSIISVQAGQLIKNSELQQLNFEKKHEAEMARVEAAKLKEMDRLKTNFFTNLSHEFRTPLTLILGPAEKINSKTSNDIIKDSGIIKRNSQRLLQLVNQLLDLSRLEAGKMKLEASKNNIVSFVKGIALSFESLSEEKDITLKIFSEKDLIEVYFDREKVIKILTNILSNSFKFTPQDGKITISISINPHFDSPFDKGGKEEGSIGGKGGDFKEGKEWGSKGRDEEGSVEIKIRDSGIGISREEIPKLFDRYYQIDSSFTREHEGTGIGLALTKELVELHHGNIRVESEKGVPAKGGIALPNGQASWTEFSINFPLGSNHLKNEEILAVEEAVESKDLISEGDDYILESIKNQSEKEIEANFSKNEKTIILVVEDNNDMREYIKDSLGEDYLVEEAVNGEQGIRKAEKIIPDLIISDMMMPKMDGNELTLRLKSNEKTSHIPIIILTAKSGQQNKLEGLQTGADDYLTKPFDINELQVRIANLIKIRRSLQEKFGKEGFSLKPEENISASSHTNAEKIRNIDHIFMKKIINIINEHISDTGFSSEDIGNEVGMSRSQVYRKVKALTGKPPNIYIRSIRLLKAKEMIKNGDGNISEIAYSIGFSSPIYFSKCFKEEFGYPPKDLTG